MLTSAVSYVPYCEKGRKDLSDSGTFSMQVANYVTRIEPIDTSSTSMFLTESVQSTAYAAEDHEWKGILVDQGEAELDPDGGNTISTVENAVYAPKVNKGELKTAVGSQCRTWSTARMAPVWFHTVMTDNLYSYIKDNNNLFTYTRPTLYDYDTTETVQQENVESAEQGISVKTFQSKHARTLISSYDDNELKVEYGKYESPYIACRMEAITDTGEQIMIDMPTDLENSPIPPQWASEFTGVYTPSVTCCKLEKNGVPPTYLQPQVFPAAVPNFYYEYVGKERPRVGGVHCSSASERNTMSLGAMFVLGKRSYKNISGQTVQHNDCIAFGSNADMNIYGTAGGGYDGEYEIPPSLTVGLQGFSGTNSLAAMENGILLDNNEQPWNTYMLSYNPSFMKVLKNGTSTPDIESRSAYNRYTSTVQIDGDELKSTCEQLLDYTFVHYGSGSPAPPAAFTIEGVCKMRSVLNYSISSAYTIAQAGNSLTNGMIYKLNKYEDWYKDKTRTVGGFTRQAKEVFPARVTKLSCKPQNSNIQGLCGLSNGTLTDTYSKKGSISPLADVETHSTPRLLSYMCIDNQFADEDTETVYGRPYIVTSGVMAIDVETETSGVTLDLSGDIGEDKTIAWPSNVNWASGKFSGGVQMGFLYQDGQRMKYAVVNSSGQVVPGEMTGDNVVEWGGEMHIVHKNGVPNPGPGFRQLYTSTPEVLGSSTTSYFFADIAE